MMRFSSLALIFLLLGASSRIVVHDETQLPRFAYRLTILPSKLVVASDAAFAPFAAKVKADVDRTLSEYDIQDRASLRDFLRTRLALQLLANDRPGARATIAALRAAQTKPDLKSLTGRLALAKLDADAQGRSLAEIDGSATAALPWSVVQDSVKEQYGGERLATKDTEIGFIKHDLDPIVRKTGTLDGASARELVRTRADLFVTLPLYAIDAPILRAYIAKHDVVKPDIWAKRDVTLTRAQIEAPVVIGIWDSGVDPTDYPSAMYVDRKGRHGIAFADDGEPSPSYLYIMPAATQAKYPRYVSLLAGFSDMETAIDSAEAEAALEYQRSLSVDAAAQFDRDFEYIGEYTHGSHVAGIAIRGNPGARIAVARFDDDLPYLQFAPTIAWAKRMAADFAVTGAYFRANHVRVVNMSWGDSVSEFEQWLAKTDKISSPQARKRKAQALFAIWRRAIESVIAGNPQALFVTAAGNGDNNASFAQDVPSSLRYPNLITVGATNQAGEATSFTSYGPTVAVFADGFHVPSKIPGGYTVKFSGTSMASPNVANLAAKLFALDPSLTPAQVRALITDGATLSPDGKRKLIDPKRSVALVLSRRRLPR